jgi:protein transport protein SEC31
MVRLCEIPRTATFAWSSDAVHPKIVTGTKAGAVDADFSNDTALELWDLDLKPTSGSAELQPSVSLTVDSRFHDVAWSQPTTGRPQGLIAGALESGALDLWDAEQLEAGKGEYVFACNAA